MNYDVNGFQDIDLSAPEAESIPMVDL